MRRTETSADAPTSPELLVPAGDRERLDAALRYGADAVYLAGPELNLRARSPGFTYEELPSAVHQAHACGVKVYYCLNILARERHLVRASACLDYLGALPPQQRPDALIVADPGILRLARRLVPRLPVHISTQANIANSEALGFWREQGARRVNLARELDCTDIRTLTAAAAAIGLEIECFVHGALCLAISGQCLLSAWLNDRPANLGACTHPCRYAYRRFSLEEKTRPDDILWDISCENGFGTVLAPEDLCLVKYLAWFRNVGVSALKLEGRMRSAGSLARSVDVYRTALDDLTAGRFRLPEYLAELENASTRRFGSGFFLPGGRRRLFGQGCREHEQPVLGLVHERLRHDAWKVSVRAPWSAATDIAAIVPGLRRPRLAAASWSLENATGIRLDRAHPGVDVTLRCEHPAIAAGLYLCAVPPDGGPR